MYHKPRIAPNGNKLPELLPVGHELVDTAKKHWLIGPSIGCGGFGDIYLTDQCKDDSTKTQEQIIQESKRWTHVIKFENFSGPLFAEINFYLRCARKQMIEDYMTARQLKHLGIPRFIASGIYKSPSPKKKYRFLVLERFGEDVQKIWIRANKRFDMNSAFNIALKVIDTLEYIHSHGYVHADVKASNLLIKTEKSKATRSIGADDQIYLVDFGLVERYSTNDGSHRPYVEDQRRANNGTVEFSSRDAHIGAFSRRSDLESLAYNMLYWVSGGRLPWTHVLKDHQLVEASKKWYMDHLEVFVNYCFNEDAHPIDPLMLLKGENGHSATNGHTNGRSGHTNGTSKASKRTSARSKSSLTNDSIMCAALYDILSYISKLQFEDEPDYHLLKTMLGNALGGSSARRARKRRSNTLTKTPPKLPKCDNPTPAMREILRKINSKKMKS